MTFAKPTLDPTDRLILEHLQAEGRATNAALAEAARVSESACSRRVRALETADVITGYVATVDQKAVGLSLSVFVSITLASQAEDALAAFEDAILRVPEVMECHLMTGEADYLLRVVAADIDHLARLHAGRLTRLPGVARINSSIAMRTVLRRTALPLR